MDFEYVIIGSGPAGVHAAYGLRGLKTLIIDAGMKPGNWDYKSIVDLKDRKKDIVDELLGQKFESLNNLGNEYLSPKLKGPSLRYITDKPAFLDQEKRQLGFLESYSQGGLGNAWGGGVYRFTDLELKDFLYKAKDLDPYYDELNSLIGIQGDIDDLSFTCGNEPKLLKSFDLTPLAQTLTASYLKKRDRINEAGFYLGRPRLALLPEPKDEREEYKFYGDDFFAPRLKGLYSPFYTLQKLLKNNEVTYEHGWVAESFEETDNGVSVFCRSIDGKSYKTFTAKKLLIGAGALNSAKIVLNSAKDFKTELPLIENPISFVPTICIRKLGAKIDHKNRIGGEALLCHRTKEGNVTYAAFYGLQGPLRSDLWSELPFTIKGRIDALNYIVPAMGIFQIFYEGYKSDKNYVKLSAQGSLKIQFDDYRTDKTIEKNLIKTLWKLGFLTHASLVKSPEPGSSIHYAGPLGMSHDNQNKFSTDENGKLRNSNNVYIIDSSAFPNLPSKNLTYTIMAHALRVASRLSRSAR